MADRYEEVDIFQFLLYISVFILMDNPNIHSMIGKKVCPIKFAEINLTRALLRPSGRFKWQRRIYGRGARVGHYFWISMEPLYCRQH